MSESVGQVENLSHQSIADVVLDVNKAKSAMPADIPNPTPYPDVNAALHDLRSDVRTILGDRFVGMYLSGSLALGDFDARRSDIDVVVVTESDISGDHLAALRAMHARFNAGDSPWATEVEAAYIPRDALRRYDPARARHPHIERGAGEVLDMDDLATDWIIHRAIVREHGVILAGPDPRTLIDAVSPQDMRRAVVGLMAVWWGPMCDDPASLERHNIGYQAYAVLTMCRILYTLDTGGVVSKPVAARWAQEALGGRWSALIEQALAWRKDGPDMPGGDLNETLDLVRYTLNAAARAISLPDALPKPAVNEWIVPGQWPYSCNNQGDGRCGNRQLPIWGSVERKSTDASKRAIGRHQSWERSVPFLCLGAPHRAR